jgi:putative pyrroloquinoline-quinone binding quinoprotein
VSGRSRRGAALRTQAVGAALAVAVLAPALGCTGDDRGDGGRASGPELDGPVSPYASSWAAVHADAANTDYSPVDPGADVALAWEEHIDGGLRVGPLPWTINLGPTLDPDGNLYLTSSEPGCHLRSLDGATGELRWCAADIDLLAVSSSPLIDRDGVLYMADGAGLHALDPDGSRRWLVPLDGVPLSVQFTSQGHLAFVTHTGTAYVLDRRDGRSLVDPVDLAPGVEWRPEDGMMACAGGPKRAPAPTPSRSTSPRTASCSPCGRPVLRRPACARSATARIPSRRSCPSGRTTHCRAGPPRAPCCRPTGAGST